MRALHHIDRAGEIDGEGLARSGIDYLGAPVGRGFYNHGESFVGIEIEHIGGLSRHHYGVGKPGNGSIAVKLP